MFLIPQKFTEDRKMSPMVLRVDIVYHINVAYDIIFTTDIFVPN